MSGRKVPRAVQQQVEQMKQMISRLKLAKKDAEQAYGRELARANAAEMEYQHLRQFVEFREQQLEQTQTNLVDRRELDEVQQTAQSLSVELEKYRDLYLKERRNASTLQTKLTQLQHDHKEITERLDTAHHSTVTDMMTRQRTLQEEVARVQTVLSKHSLENEQLLVARKKLSQEVEELRSERTSLRVLLDKVQQTSANEVKTAQRQLAVTQQELASMTERKDAMRRSLERCQADLAQESGRLSHEKQTVMSLESRLRDATQHLNTLTKASEEEEAASAERRALMARENDLLVQQLRKQLDERTTECDDLQQALQKAKRDGTAQLQKAKEEEAKALWTKEQQLTNLERQLMEVTKEKEKASIQHLEAAENMQKVIATLKHSESALQADKQRLTEQLAACEQRITHLRKDYQARIKTSQSQEAEYHALQSKHRQLMEDNHKLTLAAQRVHEENHSLKEELEKVNTRAAVRMQQQLKALKQVKSDRDALEADTSARLTAADQRITEVEAALQKLKKEKGKYKKMATVLRSRLEEATRDNTHNRKQLLQHIQTKLHENKVLTQQLQEVERQRDELKMRLSGLPGPSPLSAAPDADFENDENTHQQLQGLLARLEVATDNLATPASSSLPLSVQPPALAAQQLPMATSSAQHLGSLDTAGKQTSTESAEETKTQA